MSIDADLNMGFIDQEEAKRRRKLIERESGSYGAMDGASQVVKGDAIAGIVILLINIIGGLIIGVMQIGMRWDQALQTFTLPTAPAGMPAASIRPCRLSTVSLAASAAQAIAGIAAKL